MIYDFGVVVTLQVEHEAIKGRLKNAREKLPPGSLPFIEGHLAGFSIIVAKASSQGSVCSALAANDLLTEFQPRYLVLLGIAAGFPDGIKRGDVIIGDPIIGYEYSKVYDNSMEVDPRPFRSPEIPLESFAREEVVLNVSDGIKLGRATVRVGAIASGSKTVASQAFRKTLMRFFGRKICALEMEAEGVAQTAHHSGRDFFVFKGISDFADQKTKGKRRTQQERVEHDRWQKYAANASVEAFVRFLDHCQQRHMIAPAAPQIAQVESTATRELMAPLHTSATAREEDLLSIERGSSLSLGTLDLKCKLMPRGLWWVERRRDYLFLDEPDERNKVSLDFIDSPLPEGTLESLIHELKQVLNDSPPNISYSPKQLDRFKEVFDRLTREGSNTYPRVVAPPEIESSSAGHTLRIFLGPSRYGVALVEEWQLPLTTAKELRFRHALNSLAVRVAVIYNKNNDTWVEFHQRRGGVNATYRDAWDVGAAGYIDPRKHKDPLDERLTSPWQACAREIEEELNIPGWNLPNREHYYFFGVGRNDPTGQLDLLALCELPEAPNPDRPTTARVSRYDRCRLDPESLASFALEKRYWVPTALLNLILLLQWRDFGMARIETAFSRCVGKIMLDP